MKISLPLPVIRQSNIRQIRPSQEECDCLSGERTETFDEVILGNISSYLRLHHDLFTELNIIVNILLCVLDFTFLHHRNKLYKSNTRILPERSGTDWFMEPGDTCWKSISHLTPLLEKKAPWDVWKLNTTEQILFHLKQGLADRAVFLSLSTPFLFSSGYLRCSEMPI